MNLLNHQDGECCAIWDASGSVRNVLGPKREWIVWSDVRFLDRFIADQSHYLIVEFRDGRREHVRGPACLFLDPVVHKAISVQPAVSLNAFEAVVVYREVSCHEKVDSYMFIHIDAPNQHCSR